MHILQPQKKTFYDFWHILRYFGIDRHAPEASSFIDWLTDGGASRLRNYSMLRFDEKDTDPFMFGFQEVPSFVKSTMLKAMNTFGETEGGESRVLNLMFYY